LRLLPLAGFGFLIIFYLMLCQLGVIAHAWDPFFSPGTDQVLHSSLSRAMPIPDTVLGAATYACEILLLMLGPEDRWRSRPWVTLFSGLTSMGLVSASALLLVLQPVVVHAWCAWCLLLLGVALLLLQRSLAEFVVCFQSRVLGRWVFPASRDPAGAYPWTQGTHCDWTLCVSFVLGAITLALPDLFDIEGMARVSVTVAGASTLVVSMIAMADAVTFLRKMNAVAGLILVSWFLGNPHETARWLAAGLGTVLLGLNLSGENSGAAPLRTLRPPAP
jgi:uncharacterized membrane protein